MKRGYVPEIFWAEKGVEPALKDKEEDIFILQKLKQIQFKTVLDVGCGDGRMFDLINDNFKIEKYTGIDLSKDRLNILDKKLKNINLRYDLRYGDFLQHQFQRYDLVIASHVLLHIHPFDIDQVIKKMIGAGKHIIHIDYYPEQGKEYKELEFYNFLHPYPKMYPEPERLEKMQYNDKVALFYYNNND